MNKSILSLGVAIGAALALGTTAKADAKVVTPEEAAIKIDKAANKAAMKKKNISLTVELKSSKKAKEAKKKELSGQIKEINKRLVELAIDDLGATVDSATGNLVDDPAIEDIVSEAMKEIYRNDVNYRNDAVYLDNPTDNSFDEGEEIKVKVKSYKKNKTIINVQIKKSDEVIRLESLYGHKYNVMNANDFATRINSSMTEKEKGWEAARYVMEHMEYGRGGYTPEKFYNKKASGICSSLASIVVQYMELAGVKNCGTVSSVNENHEWNFIEDEEGKIWYLDAQDVDGILSDWRCGNLYTREEVANPERWDRTHGLAIHQMERFAWETKDEFKENFDEDNFKDDWKLTYYVKDGVSQ